MTQKFNQLIIANENEITAPQKAFLDTHRAIVNNGTMMVENGLELAYNLKKMKDEKLFEEAGFETFGEYAEQTCGLKERQAYNYLKIVETLPETFLHSNAKIGITKLSMFAGLTETEREVVVQDLPEDVSTRKLQETIKKMKHEKEQQDSEVETLKGQLSMTQEQLEDSESEKDSIVNERVEAERAKIAETVSDLEKQISALKNKPEKTKTVESEETLKKLEGLKNSLEEKSKLLESSALKISELEKRLTVENNSALVEFKLRFEEFQVLGEKLKTIINKLPDDKKAKCMSALNAAVEVLKC